MNRNRVGLIVACMFALVTIACGILLAGFESKKTICKLFIEDWQLQEKDGRLGLAKVDSGKWFASAPTITDSDNRYISGDPEGKSPTVHLVEKKNPYVNWAFTFTERLEPVKTGNRRSEHREGPSGFRFQMQMTEGPYKDWFVAVDPLPESIPQQEAPKTPAWRPLKLVRDAKQAATFTYHEVDYGNYHKYGPDSK